MRTLQPATVANRNGFTLVELLVAVVIFALLTAIAVLNQGSFLPGWRLASGTRQVIADLQLVRAKAIAQNNPFRVVFDEADPTSYYVERWNATAGDWESYALYVRGTTVPPGTPVPQRLPEDIEIRNAGTTTVTFRPRGSADWAPANPTAVLLNHTALPPAATRQVVVSLSGMVTSS